MATRYWRAAALLVGCIVTIWGLIPCGVARAQNVLVNPGFESGVLLPWFQDRDLNPEAEDWRVTQADAHSGGFAAMANGNKSVRQNFPAIPASSVAEVSFWIRHPLGPGGGLNLAFDFFYEGTSSQFVVRVDNAQWTFFNVTSFLNRTRTLTGFAVWGHTNGSITNEPPTLLDDVAVRVPEPTGAACAILLMCRLLGRRRRPQ
jgi:hypothetical protein